MRGSNKTIELPCVIGDTVYFIQHPTHVLDTSKPIIVPMRVTKVSYEAFESGYEKTRIDTSYKNKFGDDAFTFFNWDDGLIYTSLENAEEHLKYLIEKKGNEL